ncbi:MAG TPA: hypothetical protein VMR34_00015 [Candidatus Saccharimonadales bacterium]|nr:hypothetical protein [Candidatus Saccharimonadales bacterium]
MEEPKSNNFTLPTTPVSEPESNPQGQPGAIIPAKIKPAKRPTSFRAIFVYIVVLIIAGAGGGAYYWERIDVKSLTGQVSSLNSQVSNLNQQIKTLKSGQTSSTSTSTEATKVYTYNNTYSLTYPSGWAVRSKPAVVTGNNSLLDSSAVTFTPTGLSGPATPIEVTSFNSGDINTVFKQNAFPANAAYAPQSQIINGYSALYYQNIVPQLSTTNGGVGYTDDFYAVTNGSITLLFDFRESQTGSSSAQTFSSKSFVTDYSNLAKSVKFL